MIEEGSKEHRCGWEKCINCYKKVENINVICNGNGKKVEFVK
jgi:hypothetical protein